MKISDATISQIKPIIDQIDNELAKDQDERKAFKLYTNKVAALKGSLATYKSLYRRAEWNSRFWMNKRKDKDGNPYLEINFHPASRMNFVIKTDEEEVSEAPYQMVTANDAPNPGDGPALEMDDKQAATYVLTEQPTSAQFLISALSDSTKEFLADMKNARMSAFIKMLENQGYKISIKMETILRVYK